MIDAFVLRIDFLTAAMAFSSVWFASLFWRLRRPDAGRIEELSGATMLALIGGRIMWLATTAQPQLLNPIDAIRVSTGIDMITSVWIFAVVATWPRRRVTVPNATLATIALLLVPAVFAGLCVLRLDCAGKAAPWPLGLEIGGYSDLRIPIGLYEAIALGFGLWAVLRLVPPSPASPFFAILTLSAVEWSTEFGRIGGLTRATGGEHWVWLLSLSVAAIVAAEILRRCPSARPFPSQGASLRAE